MQKRKHPIPISRLIPDADPEVLRADAIADTVRALVRHGVFVELQNKERAAVAAELGVPELWLEVAATDHCEVPTVSGTLLAEWREWEARVLTAGKDGA